MNETNLPDDLKRCVDFHGHLCPGVVIGYCATRLGLRELDAGRAGDEELIAIVENDTCAVDAVQVLAGCTFGKGNLYFRDYGKMVFTFARRSDGRSVRLRLVPTAGDEPDDAPDDERRRRRIERMLARDPKELFEVRRDAAGELPAQARMHDSAPCERCGEMVMAGRLRRRDRRDLCIPCYEALEAPRAGPRRRP
ncbi:MAG: FmdE family protein [Planctomycetota bacterium]